MGIRVDELSQREREVVAILAEEGASNREIAQRMFIAEATVKQYVLHATAKLHAKNRTHLALIACRMEALAHTANVIEVRTDVLEAAGAWRGEAS